VDPAQALADLAEISQQIEAAVLADEAGEPLASTLDDAGRARALAHAAAEMFRAAGDPAPVQVEAATRTGSLFAARDRGRIVAAVTGASPPAGLVLYDLRTCLRELE
jgi:hypothetical protein